MTADLKATLFVEIFKVLMQKGYAVYDAIKMTHEVLAEAGR